VLVLAYLRKGETFADLAAGFGVGTATAWRYVTETVGPAGCPLPEAAPRAGRGEGGRVRLCSDRRHVNRDRPGGRGPAVLLRQAPPPRHEPPSHLRPDGEILWVSGPLPGAVHDLTAGRIWGILRELAASGLVVLADKGYAGAGDHVRTPYRGRGKPASQKDANRAHVPMALS
jgi:hypothetical protein